ncbi:MAG TPA: hypothetical protein VHP58_04085 [Alphaproteobacteria bacterium]|nr:hypothetical protein [Alphaproteobacteria bacterium]
MKTTRAAVRQKVKRSFTRFIPGWEWFALLAVLVLLALYVLGMDWFGLNGLLSSGFALGGALATTLIAFIMAALIGPLVALVTAAIGALIAAIGIIIGTLITPLIAFGVGIFSTLVTWLAGTWVGAMLTPIYTMLAPIVLKISPFLTTGKYAHKAYDWLDDQPWWPQSLVFTATKKQKAALAKARKAKAKAAKPRRR